jgi:hypothetical protein
MSFFIRSASREALRHFFKATALKLSSPMTGEVQLSDDIKFKFFLRACFDRQRRSSGHAIAAKTLMQFIHRSLQAFIGQDLVLVFKE